MSRQQSARRGITTNSQDNFSHFRLDGRAYADQVIAEIMIEDQRRRTVMRDQSAAEVVLPYIASHSGDGEVYRELSPFEVMQAVNY